MERMARRARKAQGRASWLVEKFAKEHDLENMPYKEFLHTQYWFQVRKMVFGACGRACQDCGNRYNERNMNVHHLDYSFRGHELENDNWRKLVCLCWECHRKRHGITGPDTKRRTKLPPVAMRPLPVLNFPPPIPPAKPKRKKTGWTSSNRMLPSSSNGVWLSDSEKARRASESQPPRPPKEREKG